MLLNNHAGRCLPTPETETLVASGDAMAKFVRPLVTFTYIRSGLRVAPGRLSLIGCFLVFLKVD